ncbi:MAG: hypothetical protein LAN64_20345 [Acidobacteriia bacterium]|nr:hypothetical protein [Terriglobia bacterium]
MKQLMPEPVAFALIAGGAEFSFCEFNQAPVARSHNVQLEPVVTCDQAESLDPRGREACRRLGLRIALA